MFRVGLAVGIYFLHICFILKKKNELAEIYRSSLAPPLHFAESFHSFKKMGLVEEMAVQRRQTHKKQRETMRKLLVLN